MPGWKEDYGIYSIVYRWTTDSGDARKAFKSKILLYSMQKRVYKFRVYPSKQQEYNLTKTLETCRFVYNKQLELKINKLLNARLILLFTSCKT